MSDDLEVKNAESIHYAAMISDTAYKLIVMFQIVRLMTIQKKFQHNIRAHRAFSNATRLFLTK